MAINTIAGWRPGHDRFEVIVDHIDVSTAFDHGFAAAVAEARRSNGDGWRFLLAYSGRHRLLASAHQVALRPPPVPRSEPFTVFGVWRHSGEAISEVIVATDAVEAITLARVRIGNQEDRVLLGAFAGRHEPVLRVENLPADYYYRPLVV